MPAVDTPIPDFEPAFALITEWPLRGVEFALQAQQMQLEAWRAWHGSLQTWQGSVFDWWSVLTGPRQ